MTLCTAILVDFVSKAGPAASDAWLGFVAGVGSVIFDSQRVSLPSKGNLNLEYERQGGTMPLVVPGIV